jgi:hypothetical protein
MSRKSKNLMIVVAAICGTLFVAYFVSQLYDSQINPHVLKQFDNADRVVLGWGSQPEITVTGQKAREIVHLITTARRITDTEGRPETIGIMLLNEMRFYQDTNYLGMIQTSHGLFSTGGLDGYEADKEKLESLVDEPFQKALEEN